MSTRVEDELAIRQLVARYANAVNSRDEIAWSATWADDSEWSLPGAGVFSGRATIVEVWRGAMAGFSFVAQLVYQGVVEINGDTATGTWYLNEHLKPKDSDNGMFNIGVYHDKYVKIDADWLFSSRIYNTLYNDEGKGDMSGRVIPFPGS